MSNNDKFNQQRNKLANLLFADSDDEKTPEKVEIS